MDDSRSTQIRRAFSASCLATACALPVLLLATGCQVEVAGQTLPSPYYLTDDIQYYAPGPAFKLAREAAAQTEQAETQPSPTPPEAP